MPKVVTPFGEELQRWLNAAPGRSVGKLSRSVGVMPQTVYNWLGKGTQPMLDVLPRVSDATGIPLMRLMELAGYMLRSPSGRDPWTTAEVFEILIARVRSDSSLDDERKRELIANLRLVQSDMQSLSELPDAPIERSEPPEPRRPVNSSPPVRPAT